MDRRWSFRIQWNVWVVGVSFSGPTEWNDMRSRLCVYLGPFGFSVSGAVWETPRKSDDYKIVMDPASKP